MATPNIIDAAGKVTVGAGTAVRWTIVLSGITVAPARVDCADPFFGGCQPACQGSHTYAPGGTPLGGTFEVTKDAWDELDALIPGSLPSPTTGYDDDCRWAYYENPGTTMIGGKDLVGLPHDLSDASPPTIFAVIWYKVSGKFVCKVVNYFTGTFPNGAYSEAFDSFPTSDGDPDCDRNAITVGNWRSACSTTGVGKLGTVTATRCT